MTPRDSGAQRVRPPVVAQWLVALLAPPSVRDAVLGDMAEGFERRVVSGGDGQPASSSDVTAARRWYWRQATGSIHLAYAYPRRLRRPGARASGFASDLLTETRLAVRALWHRRGYSVLVVATLALGIAANATIFSFGNAVLFRALPFPEPDRLMTLWERNVEEGGRRGVAPPTFVDWKEATRTFSDLAAFERSGFVLTGGSQPERVSAVAASPNVFRLLGNRWLFGSGFGPDNDYSGDWRVVVTSAEFARRWFGEGSDPVNRTLTLNDQPFRVVGVLPDDFRFLVQPELWVPRRFESAELTEGMRGARYMDVMGRIAPGVTVERASEDMSTLARALGEQHPNNRGWDVTLVGLHDFLIQDVRRPMLLILAAVAFVLLIALGNTANLILTRATAARRDWALRAALGASGWRLYRTSLIEHLLLAGAGGTAALVLTAWALPSVVGLAPVDMPRLTDVGVDAVVAGFVVVVSLVIGLLMSALPWVSGVVSDKLVRLAGRDVSLGTPRSRLRDSVIAGEVAISMVLLVGAGLLTRSFREMRSVDPGFDVDGLFAASLSLPNERYQTATERVGFAEELTERLASVPGVRTAALTNNLPFSGSRFAFSFHPDHSPPQEGERSPNAEFHSVGPGHFSAMRIPLLAGRDFARTDGLHAPSVVVINEVIAQRFWPDADPVGDRLTVVSQGGAVSREIVGVVGSVKHGGPSSEWIPEVYVPFSQDTWSFLTVVLRADEASVAAATRQAVASVDATLPAPSVRPMAVVAAQWFAPLRFQMLLAGAFAAFALSLACVGLYGVISYVVHLRTAEIGIRIALGAHRDTVFWSMVRMGGVLAGVGLVIGISAAALIMRAVERSLFGVVPVDPLTYGAAATLVLAVAFAASALPAWRATRIDPVAALRGL